MGPGLASAAMSVSARFPGGRERRSAAPASHLHGVSALAALSSGPLGVRLSAAASEASPRGSKKAMLQWLVAVGSRRYLVEGGQTCCSSAFLCVLEGSKVDRKILSGARISKVQSCGGGEPMLPLSATAGRGASPEGSSIQPLRAAEGRQHRTDVAETSHLDLSVPTSSDAQHTGQDLDRLLFALMAMQEPA